MTPLLPLAFLNAEIPKLGGQSPANPEIWEVFTAALTQLPAEDDPEPGFPSQEQEETFNLAGHTASATTPSQITTLVDPAVAGGSESTLATPPAEFTQSDTACYLSMSPHMGFATESAPSIAVASDQRMHLPATRQTLGVEQGSEPKQTSDPEITPSRQLPLSPQSASTSVPLCPPAPDSPDREGSSTHGAVPVRHESGQLSSEKGQGAASPLTRSLSQRILTPAVFDGPVVVVKEILQSRREPLATVEAAEALQQPAIDLLQQADRSTGSALRTAVADERPAAIPSASPQSFTGSERPLPLDPDDPQSPTRAGDNPSPSAAAQGTAYASSNEGTGSTASTPVPPQVPGPGAMPLGLVHPAPVGAAGIPPRIEIGVGHAAPIPGATPLYVTETLSETEESRGLVQSVEVTIRPTEDTRVSLRFVERGSGVEVVARTNSPELGRALGEQLSELSRMTAQDSPTSPTSSIESATQPESGPGDSSSPPPRGQEGQQRGEEQQQRDRHLLRWLTAMDSEVIAGQQARNGVSQ